jgi:uncharacterized alkaline shock family protein YloU
MIQPNLAVQADVIDQTIRLAALKVPGVARIARGGPTWRARLEGRALVTRQRDRELDVRIWIVARPGIALGPLAASVQGAVAGAVQQLLGLESGSVTVLIDGVGG